MFSSTVHQVGNKVKDCSFSTVLSAFSCSKISLLYRPLKRFTTDWPQVLMPSKMTSGVSFKFSALMKCWPQVWIFTPKVQIFSLWVLCIVFAKQFITMITLWVLMHHLLMFLIRMTRLQPSKAKPLFFLEPEIIKKTIEIAAWTRKASASVTNQNVNKIKEVLQSIDCGNVLMYFRPNNDLIFILQITGYILVQQLFDKRLLLSPLLADFVALIDNVHCSCRRK